MATIVGVPVTANAFVKGLLAAQEHFNKTGSFAGSMKVFNEVTTMILTDFELDEIIEGELRPSEAGVESMKKELGVMPGSEQAYFYILLAKELKDKRKIHPANEIDISQDKPEL